MSPIKKTEFEYTLGLRPSPEMLAQIQTVVENCVKKCVDKELEKTLKKLVDEKLPELLRECLEEKEKTVPSGVMEFKRISHEKAKREIEAYIDKHQGCLTSDIIYDLSLDPDLVLDVLKELEKKKTIRGKVIDQ